MIDLAVEANKDSDGGYAAGAVYILFLSSSGVVTSHQQLSNSYGNLGFQLDVDDWFGMSIASVGDLDDIRVPYKCDLDEIRYHLLHQRSEYIHSVSVITYSESTQVKGTCIE